MFLKKYRCYWKKFMRWNCSASMSLAASIGAAQVPDYEFSFSELPADANGGSRRSVLQVDILPSSQQQVTDVDTIDGIEPVPALLTLQAQLYSGRWLADLPEVEIAAEAFVLAKFNLFRTAESATEFREFVDETTYASMLDSIERGQLDLAADREIYREYDNIRVLGAIHYGDLILLYTQFRSAVTGEVMPTVMPAIKLGDRLVTAAAMHQVSHELYRMLAFGTMMPRLMEFFEAQSQP